MGRGERLFAERECLHLEIDADDLLSAARVGQPGALAELGEAQMGCVAQFQSRCDQNAVNFKARAPFEFEEDVDQSGIGRATAKDPAAACENCAGHGLDHTAWLFAGDRPHLESPRDRAGSEWFLDDRCLSHIRYIGGVWRAIKLCK